MSFLVRTSLAVLSSCLVAIIAAGCGGDGGGSPLRPSGSSGAVIAGTVTPASASASTARSTGSARTIRPADSPFAGITVRVVGANLSTTVGADGQFQISDVPGGTVRLQFTGDGVNATITISNVKADQFIEIQIQVSGSSAEIVDEARTGKVSLCHAEGNGSYHLIDVAESAEPAHRDHGDAEIGEPVPGRPNMIFDTNCRPTGPSVEIDKTTNGDDGLEILVGTAITWRYVVSNTGTVPLTGVGVTDSRGVAVSCPSTTLAAGNSMTCTGTGVAVAGAYSNIGTVTAGFTFNSTSGTVTDSDGSSYRGITLEEQEQGGPKVTLCHRTGNGSFHLISVSIDAEPAHLAHGDGRPGGAVPGQAGRSFSATCSVQ
jgi:uncharacterized repeat protein (TIGR01451 family)